MSHHWVNVVFETEKSPHQTEMNGSPNTETTAICYYYIFHNRLFFKNRTNQRVFKSLRGGILKASIALRGQNR